MSEMRPKTNYPEELAQEALTWLKLGEPEHAFRRLIDAAGLLKRDCFINPMAMGTKSNPTMTGFYLGEVEKEA